LDITAINIRLLPVTKYTILRQLANATIKVSRSGDGYNSLQ